MAGRYNSLCSYWRRDCILLPVGSALLFNHMMLTPTSKQEAIPCFLTVRNIIESHDKQFLTSRPPQALLSVSAADTTNDMPCCTHHTGSVCPGYPCPRTHNRHSACTCDEGCPCTSHSLASSCVPRPLHKARCCPHVQFWSRYGRSH